MAGPGVIIDLVKLFQGTFGSTPYVIPGVSDPEPMPEGFKLSEQYQNYRQLVTPAGSLIQENVKGVDIWLPVKFFDQDTLLMSMPYSVVRLTPKKTIIRTPMMERNGTAKEQYNIDDYVITIKGFLIGSNGQFPEAELIELKQLWEIKNAVSIENAITNIYLSNPALPRFEQRRVVITDLDFPEVQGGRKHVRPFSMQLESDTVFTLELDV